MNVKVFFYLDGKKGNAYLKRTKKGGMFETIVIFHHDRFFNRCRWSLGAVCGL